MLTLQLFGGASLLDPSGPGAGVPIQRRRLAVLAALAAAPNGSLSRDKLIGYFWAEQERERARHFLADSLFSLRKSVGKEAITNLGDDLAINRELLECDVWRFHAALENSDLERAVLCYRGPFLDGFWVSDAGEFERWVEEERARLAGLYSTALETLADRASSAGDAAGSAKWWRLLAAHDPLSSRIALQLMRALANAGDRAAAIQHARIHAALLAQQLEIGPDAEVSALAEELTWRTRPAPPVSTAPSPIPEVLGASSPVDDRTPQLPILHNPGPDPGGVRADGVGASSSEGAGGSRRYLAVLVSLLLLALSGGMAAFWSEARDRRDGRQGASANADATDVIAILPFSYRGNGESAYLAEGSVTLFSTSLSGAGELRSIDPYVILSQSPAEPEGIAISTADARSLALSLGANQFLLGSIVESSGRLEITATLYDTADASGEGIRVAARGSVDDVFLLVDEISGQILVRKFESPSDRLSHLALLTTGSLPALKSYLEGDIHFRAARYPEAVTAFRTAVQLDPDFALGHYRLSMAAEWSFRFLEARQSAEKALELSDGLATRFYQLVSAWHHFVNGEAVEAERLFQMILADDPYDVEALSGIGEVRLHYNPIRGLPISDAQAAFEEVLRLAPNYGEARFHLLEFAAGRGDQVAFDSLLAQVDPRSGQALSWKAARTYAWGEEDSLNAMAPHLADAEDVVVGIAAVRAGVHFRDLEAAGRLAALLTTPARQDAWRAAGHVMAAQASLARGNWEAGGVSLEAAEAIETSWALELRALGALLPLIPQESERLRALRQRLEAWDPSETQPELAFFFQVHADLHVQLRLYLLAMLSVPIGDEEAVDRYLTELRSSGRTNSGREVVSALVRSVLAHRAEAEGDYSEALEHLEQGELRAPLERVALSPIFAQSADRYLRAEVLARLDRQEEALHWYASLTDGPDILYWTAAHRGQAEVLTVLGRSNEAALHVERASRP